MANRSIGTPTTYWWSGSRRPLRPDVRVGVLSGRHLLVCPSWLALLTSRHRPHRLDWGLAVPSTLPTRVPGESIRVPMLPARSVLKRDVVSVNDLDPSRGLPHRVLTPVQPAHSAVVRSDRDLLSVQIAFKVCNECSLSPVRRPCVAVFTASL